VIGRAQRSAFMNRTVSSASSLLASTFGIQRASVMNSLSTKRALCQPPNKQLERTVTRRRGRAASAPFHYALAARWTAQRAAAQLRR
jgi:hypothetical protein